jgi:hypothetical protein
MKIRNSFSFNAVRKYHKNDKDEDFINHKKARHPLERRIIASKDKLAQN